MEPWATITHQRCPEKFHQAAGWSCSTVVAPAASSQSLPAGVCGLSSVDPTVLLSSASDPGHVPTTGIQNVIGQLSPAVSSPTAYRTDTAQRFSTRLYVLADAPALNATAAFVIRLSSWGSCSSTCGGGGLTAPTISMRQPLKRLPMPLCLAVETASEPA